MEEVEKFVISLRNRLDKSNKEDKTNGIIFIPYQEYKKFKLIEIQKYQNKYDLEIEKNINSKRLLNEPKYIRTQTSIAVCRKNCPVY